MESMPSAARPVRCVSGIRRGSIVNSMPKFSAIEVESEGASIHVRLRLDRPRALAWQVLDPVTGTLLLDGKCPDAGGADIDLRVVLPPEDGPYRLQLAPED